MLIESLTIGLSLYTWHPSNYNAVPELRLNNHTPGIYIRNDGFTVSIFRNSWGRTSFMAGVNTRLGPFDLILGAATGYQKKTIYFPCSHSGIEVRRNEAKEHPGAICPALAGSTNAILKPIVGISCLFPLSVEGISPRISFLGNALNLSLEHKF